MKKIYIWHAGNGRNIGIWEVAWIPNRSTRKTICSKGCHLLSRVSNLINPVSNNYDEDLVRKTSCPIDAQMVLAIPFPQHAMQDFVTWNFKKNTLFSVQSAYFMEWDHQHGMKLRHTNGRGWTTYKPIWCKIWRLSRLTKYKIFMWRTLHGTLPCHVTLAHIHLKTSLNARHAAWIQKIQSMCYFFAKS